MLTIPQPNNLLTSRVPMPIWAFLRRAIPQLASAGVYEFPDVCREELDFPIPHSAYLGYQPEREVAHFLPVTSSRESDEEEQDPGYCADDELSKVEPSASSKIDYGTDATDATVQEERCGATERSECNQSHLSPFSYYYYPDPDYDPQDPAQWMSEALEHTLLDLVEDAPRTKAESWMQCKQWRYQVAQAIDNDLLSGDRINVSDRIEEQAEVAAISIFQMLHDQPVEAVDKMKAVSDWQGTVVNTGFDSIPSAPASLVSDLARRKSIIVLRSHGCGSDQVSPLGIGSPPPPNHAAEMEDLPVILENEEPQCIAVPFTDSNAIPLAQSYSPSLGRDVTRPACEEVPLRAKLEHDEHVDGVMPPGHHAAEARRLMKSLTEFPVPDLKQVLDHQVGMANPHHEIVNLGEYTPQRVRGMISSLNAPSTNIKYLKAFWEGQR